MLRDGQPDLSRRRGDDPISDSLRSFEAREECSVAASRSQASTPISRSSLVVRHGDDFDAVWNLSIDDAVGKLAEDVPSRASLEARPDGRRGRNQSQRFRHFTNECLCSLDASLQIPLERIIDLPESFRGKLNLGAAHSVSPGSLLGSLPRESSRSPLPPALPPARQLPGAKPSQRRLQAAGAPGFPATRPRSQRARFLAESRLHATHCLPGVS